jgi:NCS1 family nucleobase:cation symporter-1
MTALLPRYLTIRRGGLVSLAIALCICPWHLASSNSNFATYLSAYSVLLAPFIGILLSDYYIVRRGKLHVPDLYTLNRQGTYWYSRGANFRAYLAYLAGLVINIVGFAGAVGATVSETATHIYTLAFFTGSLLSALVYVTLCHVFPPPGLTHIREKKWLEPKGGYEAEDWSNPTAGKTPDPEDAEASYDDSREGSLSEKKNVQDVQTVEY